MAWYRAGTVSVTNNSSTVTGASTDFAANSRVGDAFIGPDGKMYEVTNVASATVISITPNYSGSTASGQSYSIVPVQGYTKSLADQAAQLVNDFGDKGTAYSRDVVTSNSDTTANRLLQVGAIGAQLGADVYRRANIVGTVSQSGGVPTGAVLAVGSGPNGRYEILADGTVNLWHTVSSIPGTSFLHGIHYAGVPAWNYPVSGLIGIDFISAFPSGIIVNDDNSFPKTVTRIDVNSPGLSVLTSLIVIYSQSTSLNSCAVNLFAKGRLW